MTRRFQLIWRTRQSKSDQILYSHWKIRPFSTISYSKDHGESWKIDAEHICVLYEDPAGLYFLKYGIDELPE